MSTTFSARTRAEEVVDKFSAEAAGKYILITGANSGLGLETCRVLAMKGAKVVVACRNPKLAEEAITELKTDLPSADVHFLHLDLGDIKSLKRSADEFSSKFGKLDILINNAGVMACPKTFTTDGIEMQFAVNHLGHFYLTQNLLPLLEKSGTKDKPSRVVNLSSIAQMIFAPHEGIVFDDMNAEKSYRDWERYGQSKLANVLFSNELNNRYKDGNVISISLHPGLIAKTNLSRHLSIGSIFRMMGSVFFRRKGSFRLLMKQAYKSIPERAATTVVVALDPDVKPGGYYSDCQETGGSDLHPKANDAELAKRLWEVSEQMCNEIMNNQ